MAQVLLLLLVAATSNAQTITQIFDGSIVGCDGPLGVAVDEARNVYVACFESDNAFKITPSGEVTEIINGTGDGFGNLLDGSYAIAVDGAGNVYLTGEFSDNAFKIESDGSILEIVDETGDGRNALDAPVGIAVHASGNVYVSGSMSSNAFRIEPDGTIEEIIDASGDGTASLNGAERLVVDRVENVYLAAIHSHNVFRISLDGSIEEIINASGDGTHPLMTVAGIAVDEAGSVYVTGQNSDNAFEITPSGTISQIIDAAGDEDDNGLEGSFAVAVDGLGNVFVSGGASHNVFKIMPEGGVSEIIDFAGDGEGNRLLQPFGLAVDDVLDVYVSGLGSDNLFKIEGSGLPCPVYTGTLAGIQRYAQADDPPVAVVTINNGILTAIELDPEPSLDLMYWSVGLRGGSSSDLGFYVGRPDGTVLAKLSTAGTTDVTLDTLNGWVYVTRPNRILRYSLGELRVSPLDAVAEIVADFSSGNLQETAIDPLQQKLYALVNQSGGDDSLWLFDLNDPASTRRLNAIPGGEPGGMEIDPLNDLLYFSVSSGTGKVYSAPLDTLLNRDTSSDDLSIYTELIDGPGELSLDLEIDFDAGDLFFSLSSDSTGGAIYKTSLDNLGFDVEPVVLTDEGLNNRVYSFDLMCGKLPTCANKISVKPDRSEVNPFDDATVEVVLEVEAADEIYGLQANLQFRPPNDLDEVLVTGSLFGDYFGEAPTLNVGPNENSTSWDAAASLYRANVENPPDPVSGAGQFASFTLSVPSTPGVLEILGQARFSGPKGECLSGCLIDASIEILEGHNVAGRVDKESVFICDPDQEIPVELAGTSVTLENVATGERRTTETDSQGMFSFPGLLDGNYWLTASAVPYALDCMEVTVAGGDVNLGSLEMLIGDFGDGSIDIADFELMEENWGLSGGDIFEPLVDLNQDGTVDIFDLTILGANIGVSSSCSEGLMLGP